MYSADRNRILHTSWQCSCRDVCKISLWLAEYLMNKTITKFHCISNSIKTSLVGQAPGDATWCQTSWSTLIQMWLVTCLVPSHFLTQCSLIDNWTLGNTTRWNLNPNPNISFQENVFKNVCKCRRFCWSLNDICNKTYHTLKLEFTKKWSLASPKDTLVPDSFTSLSSKYASAKLLSWG